jgi:hypothetical protein
MRVIGSIRRLAERIPRWCRGREAHQAPRLLTAEQELAALRPRIVPAALFGLGLPGPRADLVLPGLALSWVLLVGPREYRHVTDAMVARWTTTGADWQQIALDNLRPRHARDRDRRLFTGAYDGPDGRSTCAFALHDDGLGLSRLLLHADVARLFPDGYRVALPDMQAGMVLAATAPQELAAAFLDTVQHYYAEGGAPLRAGLYDPALLRVREPTALAASEPTAD